MPNQTLNSIIDNAVKKFPSLPIAGIALEQPLTYTEYHDRIIALAGYLSDNGVDKGDRVAILAENSHYWGIVYLAITRLGAIAVPILPNLPEADVHHILKEMEVETTFVSQNQLEKIYEVDNGFLKKTIVFGKILAGEEDALVSFTDILDEALVQFEKGEVRHETFLPVAEDDLASILYTSGTSGFSKAVMLSHKNIASNALSAAEMMDLEPESALLSILPVSHTYEFTLGFILPIIKGARIAYLGKTPTPAILQKVCSVEKPSAIFVVPLVMEKIYKKRVLPKINDNKVLSMICKFAPGRRLIYKKIGAKLLDFFGGNLRIMGIGGAALNPEVENFLSEAEFPYIIGYGLTESSPILSGGPVGDNTVAIGSAGKIFPNVSVKIVDADPTSGIGEIFAKGPNIMQGYYNNPEDTAKTLIDGWLATGDLGYLDKYGNLFIKGRSKNVIVMANGENIYPEPIEHKVNAYPWIMESLVLENNARLECQVYLDYDLIDEETKGQSQEQQRQYIAGILDKIRSEVNEQLSQTSRITKMFERREPFVKTATHKIKRYLYT